MPLARCCHPVQDEFATCYASALVFGVAPALLAQKVSDLEAGPLTPCFTAWCSSCRGKYLLTQDVARFPSPSAHHTHKLVLLQMLKQEGLYV